MTVDLTDVRTAADTAAATAADLRARVDGGDTTVTPDELAAAEAAERLASVQLTGAQRRDQERRDREAAAQLERDRAAIQQEWAATGTEPDDLVQLRAAAVDAARAYIQRYTAHQDYLTDLHRRAAAAGFKVAERAFRPSPLPRFGRDVVDASRDVMDRMWTHVNLSVRNSNIWG